MTATATNPRAAVIAAIIGAAAAVDPFCVREPWVCARCNGALCSADHCPMGGVHDPGDSDRPCPRCGASPR